MREENKMSQNVHFLKLKVFNDELIKFIKPELLTNLLQSLWDSLGDESDKEGLLFDNIDVKFVINAEEESIQDFFEEKELLILQDEGYYLVNDKLWESIETEIWNQIQENWNQIQQRDEQNFDKQKTKIIQISNYNRDLEKLKQYYENNQLILEVS